MPVSSRPNRPFQIAQVVPGSGPLRVHREPTPPPNPNPPPPGWAFLLLFLVLTAVIVAVTYWMRRRAYRAWQGFAREVSGEFRPKDGLSPRLVSGELRGRPFLMETATSHEDEAGYYHTRVRVPIKNTGSLILGLRRKSFLEQTQTRGKPPPYSLEDADFESQFFLYSNDSDNLALVLTPEARKELSRYHDVEIYIRMSEMEWRRAGEQHDPQILRRLTNLLLDMAETVDSLPTRGRSLTQVLADEKLIEKGV